MEFYGQTISKSSSEPYDLVRTSRMAGYGLLILGPSLHLWFNLMSKLFPKRDLISTLKKMAMGQLLYGPTMTVVFFSLNARLQGESGDEIVSRLKRDLLPTMLNVAFILTAVGEQFVLIFMDCLYDIHGKSRETGVNYLLNDLLPSISRVQDPGFSTVN
ncbi:hypothetical protein Gorai_002359 [Gossypium raimondii]|uniref:Uncharacterized protein n=1 Tax=Gossypium raimondii TaxID=29730 RepID=A0A7J8QKS2_GOSRA|nr:hypothetical protein [Gossypium raimondii]